MAAERRMTEPRLTVTMDQPKSIDRTRDTGVRKPSRVTEATAMTIPPRTISHHPRRMPSWAGACMGPSGRDMTEDLQG